MITTNNEVLLRNTKELLPIVCEQKTVKKEKIKEHLLRKANKNGFGNEVGSVTNKCTGMFDVLASFDKDSEEYNIILDRIMCMQAYQQEVIDSVKGCVAKEVPSHWYSYRTLKEKNDDTEEIKQWKKEQLKLASCKKPYFFIYNYKHLMNKYKKYLRDSNSNSLIRFGITTNELYKKENKNEEEIDFLKYYEILMPVFTHKSTMNEICWALEDKFKDVKYNVNSEDNFDIDILKSEYTYAKPKYEEIKQIYENYKKEVKDFMIISKDMKSEEKKQKRISFVNNFRKESYKACSNRYVLCNILIDMCYKQNGNKQFVWDMCGDVIVENLLNKSNNGINYPIEVNMEDADFIWNNCGYKIIQKQIDKEDDFFYVKCYIK